MADSEIRLRFSAQGIRQIRDDMRATGQEGTEAFAKIQTAVAKGAVTLKSAQKELEQYEAALKAMGHTDTTTFAQLSGVNRTFNPTQTGVPTYQGPQASAYSRGASAGQSNLAQRTLALTDAINPLAVAERKMSGAVAEADRRCARAARISVAVGTLHLGRWWPSGAASLQSRFRLRPWRAAV